MKPTLTACLFFALVSSATAGPALELTLTSAKVVDHSADGTSVSGELPADQATSGDTVIYRIAYHNAGDSAAVNPSLTGIIPRGAVILPLESSPPDAIITYSIDGADTFHPFPITEDRATPSGVIVSRSVPLSEYTHVRFKLQRSVAPGERGRVEFRVRVE